jgi:hypothetical protein
MTIGTIVVEPQWVGIDASQAWLDIVLRPAGTYWRLCNQEPGWAELITHLQSLEVKLVMLESTAAWNAALSSPCNGKLLSFNGLYKACKYGTRHCLVLATARLTCSGGQSETST